MRSSIRYWLPEFLLFGLLLFFTYRELGTFPAAWADDSLFMIVARSLAEGNGYALPLLEDAWHMPFTLHVGPPLILPTALSIYLFGFSVCIARIPMTLFLIGTVLAFYVLTNTIVHRNAARWSSGLLITLSAFINNGKPVLGEVPGFFFILLGLLCLVNIHQKKIWWIFLGGICFGLAILTKMTYALLLPALGIAWIVSVIKKDRRMLTKITIVGLLSLCIYLPWRFLETGMQKGWLHDFLFIWGRSTEESAMPFAHVLSQPDILFRIPFLAYGTFFFFGSIGLWHMHKRNPKMIHYVIATLIVLFTVYFLSSFGWYRHLLPAHILLLIFVPVGVDVCLSYFPIRKTAQHIIATAFLLALLCVQGWWQFDHRGASTSTEAQKIADILQQQYKTTSMIIQQAEVFVLLPQNSHWYFITNPKITENLPEDLIKLSETTRCLPILRKLDVQRMNEWGDRITLISGRYYLLYPERTDCSILRFIDV